jgi:hypothetical protein
MMGLLLLNMVVNFIFNSVKNFSIASAFNTNIRFYLPRTLNRHIFLLFNSNYVMQLHFAWSSSIEKCQINVKPYLTHWFRLRIVPDLEIGFILFVIDHQWMFTSIRHLIPPLVFIKLMMFRYIILHMSSKDSHYVRKVLILYLYRWLHVT